MASRDRLWQRAGGTGTVRDDRVWCAGVGTVVSDRLSARDWRKAVGQVAWIPRTGEDGRYGIFLLPQTSGVSSAVEAAGTMGVRSPLRRSVPDVVDTGDVLVCGEVLRVVGHR